MCRASQVLKKDVLVEDDDVECAIAEKNVLAKACMHPYLTKMHACFQSAVSMIERVIIV